MKFCQLEKSKKLPISRRNPISNRPKKREQLEHFDALLESKTQDSEGGKWADGAEIQRNSERKS